MGYILFFLLNYLAAGLGVWLAIRDGERFLHQPVSQQTGDGVATSMVTVETDTPSNGGNVTQEVVSESLTADNTKFEDAVRAAEVLQTRQEEVLRNKEEESIAGPQNIGTTNEFASNDIAVENTPVTDEKYDEVMSVAGPVKGLGEATNIISESNIIRDEILVDEQSDATENSAADVAADGEHIGEKYIDGKQVEDQSVSHQWQSVEMIEEVVGLIGASDEGLSDEFREVTSQLQGIQDLFIDSKEPYFASENAEFAIKPDESMYINTTICRPVICKKKLQALSQE